MCLFGSVLIALATSEGLITSVQTPIADGKVGLNEYALTSTHSNMILSYSFSSDRKTVYFALQAPTVGWVALGLGSLKMNGAFMVLGNVVDGKQTISEETGKGHSHKPNAEKILISSAVVENDVTTVLEFSLPADEYIKANALKMILAYGKGDSFSSIHAKFGSLELPIPMVK